MNDYPEFSIHWDWLSAPTVKAPELRATWARLEIHLGADPVTLVEDRDSRSSRRSIYTSLYPLAEWLAYNWWFLQADSRPAMLLSRLRGGYDSLWNSCGPRLLQRHTLRGVGDGFLWPNLSLVPEGTTTRLTWRADRAPDSEQAVRFLTSGEATVDSAALQRRLAGFVDAVIERLSDENVDGTTLAAEWAAIQRADADEAHFCLAAARLGLDPYSEAGKYEPDILAAAAELGETDMLDDFLDVVDPDRIPESLRWISEASSEVDRLVNPLSEQISMLRSSAQATATEGPSSWEGLRPWDVGWRQAQLIRTAAGVGPDEPFSIEDLVRSSVRQYAGPGLQALGRTTESSAPLLVLSRPQLHEARRFTLARAMWHVLWQDSPTFLVTSAHTDRQKVERAFAAELLAPADGIATRVGDDGGLAEPELEDIARHYGVSPVLIEHQLENQVVRQL